MCHRATDRKTFIDTDAGVRLANCTHGFVSLRLNLSVLMWSPVPVGHQIANLDEMVVGTGQHLALIELLLRLAKEMSTRDHVMFETNIFSVTAAKVEVVNLLVATGHYAERVDKLEKGKRDHRQADQRLRGEWPSEHLDKKRKGSWTD